MKIDQFYSREEEISNTISHALGILLGVGGGYILISAAIRNPDVWALPSVIVYLMGMLSSYITSTCYHASTNGHRKSIWRKCDHAAIYLHIAGTYIPFILLILRNVGIWGWALFSFISLASVAGVILSFAKLKNHSNLETICFILMGCSILIAFKPLYEVLSMEGKAQALYWLIAGGVSYIGGAIFYSWKRKYMHTIFHLFVLGGSICHIISIYIIL